MIRRLLRRLLFWALSRELDKLDAVVRASGPLQRLAERALSEALEASERAQCISSIDVPIQHDHGVLTVTAIVRGQTVVHAFIIPPMSPDGLRALIDHFRRQYGAINFVDAPSTMPAIHQLVGRL